MKSNLNDLLYKKSEIGATLFIDAVLDLHLLTVGTLVVVPLAVLERLGACRDPGVAEVFFGICFTTGHLYRSCRGRTFGHCGRVGCLRRRLGDERFVKAPQLDLGRDRDGELLGELLEVGRRERLQVAYLDGRERRELGERLGRRGRTLSQRLRGRIHPPSHYSLTSSLNSPSRSLIGTSSISALCFICPSFSSSLVVLSGSPRHPSSRHLFFTHFIILE